MTVIFKGTENLYNHFSLGHYEIDENVSNFSMFYQKPWEVSNTFFITMFSYYFNCRYKTTSCILYFIRADDITLFNPRKHLLCYCLFKILLYLVSACPGQRPSPGHRSACRSSYSRSGAALWPAGLYTVQCTYCTRVQWTWG